MQMITIIADTTPHLAGNIKLYMLHVIHLDVIQLDCSCNRKSAKNCVLRDLTDVTCTMYYIDV